MWRARDREGFIGVVYRWVRSAGKMKPSDNGKVGLEPVGWAAGGVALERALLEVVIVTLWRILAGLGAPVRRLFSFVLWCGLSVRSLAFGILRIVKRVVKWLAGSYDMAWMGGSWYPSTLKRYHVAFGECVVKLRTLNVY